MQSARATPVTIRPIALAVVVTLSASLFISARVRGVRQEGDAIGALAGAAGVLAVNLPPVTTVNSVAQPTGSSNRDDAEPPMSARDVLEHWFEEIRALVHDAAPDEVVTRTLGSMVDYVELARHTLGKPCPLTVPSCVNHWDGLTGEQQSEMAGLVRKLAEKSAQKHFTKARRYAISIESAHDLGNGRSRIRTVAKENLAPQQPVIRVDYVVLSSNEQHRVIDVVTEGSSMTTNYYRQFHRMLTTPDEGYAFMVKKLEAKIARP